MLSIKKFLYTYNPDIIINTIAVTSIELCEKQSHKAFEINARSISKILKILPKTTYLIHISTDQVYPNGSGPFKESQVAKNGSNVYAESKIKAESIVKKHPNHLILRTNFFGKSKLITKKSLSDIIIYNAIHNIKMPLYDDLFFSPLHVTTLCKLIENCIKTNLKGIYNLGSSNGISKANFGIKILDILNLKRDNFYITNSDTFNSRILRSKDLRLDCSLIEKKLSIKLPSIEREITKLQKYN